MKLSELIEKVGDDNVMFQNLDNDTTNMKTRKDGQSEVTFGTQMSFGVDGTERLGLIVWLDREAVKKVTGGDKS